MYGEYGYMEEGALWEVYIPGDLAFRKPGKYGGQTLVFEIELLSVEKPDRDKTETGQIQDNVKPVNNRSSAEVMYEPETESGQESGTEYAALDDLPEWQRIEASTQSFFEQNARKEG